MVETANDTTDAPKAGQFAQLAVRSGGQTVRTIPITRELRIGRDPENDLIVDGSGVGRHHARIYPRDGSLFLCNEGTVTTWVNGITLIGHRRLHDGDRIRIAKALLVYHAALYPVDETINEEDAEALLAALGGAEPPLQVPGRLRWPWQSKEARSPNGRQRTRSVVPTPAGLLVLVAIAAIVAYIIAPDTFEPRRTERWLTPAIAASAPGPVAARTRSTDGTGDGNSPASLTASSSPTPDEVTASLAEAQTLALRSRFDAAIEQYQSLAERVPRDARVEAAWAWALILDGDVEQGLVHAKDATQIDPDSVQAWIALARAYVAQGNASSALSAGRKAVDLAEGPRYPPGDENAARAHAMLAEAYLLGDLLPQAVEQAELAIDYSPQAADALSVRGRLYLFAEADPEAAVSTLRRAAELEPELWVRHQELGLMLLELGQYRAAIESLTEAMVLSHKPVTYTALGRAYYYLEEYDQGKSYLEQSLSLGADDVETYALLAAMNAEQRRCDDARVYYNHAFERELAHPLALRAKELCESGAIPSQAGTAGTSPPDTTGTASVPTSTPMREGATPAPVTPLPHLRGWIVFSTWNTGLDHYDTYIARPDGSDRRLIAAQMHQPAFRPDGQWLALNGEQPLHMNIHVVPLDGGEPIEVSTYLEDRLPHWSPDGEALVYSSTRHPDRQPRLYIVDQVPLDGRRAQDRPVRADLYEVLGDFPAWLPDGRIVYTGCDWSSGSAQCGLLAVSSAPGTHTLQALTDYPGDTAAAAGPNGQIAFMSDRDGNWEVYLLTADGSMRRLTQHAANDGLPAWSPDGDYLAFVSDRDGAWAVWVMRPDGSSQRRLFELGDGGLAVDWQHESISWGR